MMYNARRAAICLVVLAGASLCLADAKASNVVLKGVVYDLDGKTPLTSPTVNITIKNSAGTVVKTGTSSATDGTYNLTYDNSMLVSTDFQIVVIYTRMSSTNSLTISGLSGFNANPQTMNPVVPRCAEFKLAIP